MPSYLHPICLLQCSCIQLYSCYMNMQRIMADQWKAGTDSLCQPTDLRVPNIPTSLLCYRRPYSSRWTSAEGEKYGCKGAGALAWFYEARSRPTESSSLYGSDRGYSVDLYQTIQPPILVSRS